MKRQTENKVQKKNWKATILYGCIFLVLLLVVQYFYQKNKTPSITQEQQTEIGSIHEPTGFIIDDGMQTVITNCTSCHSAALVTQNRMSKEGWMATIRWMQETQNLWDLGDNEAIIVDYLAKHYAPEAHGRRKSLNITEWYELKE